MGETSRRKAIGASQLLQLFKIVTHVMFFLKCHLFKIERKHGEWCLVAHRVLKGDVGRGVDVFKKKVGSENHQEFECCGYTLNLA